MDTVSQAALVYHTVHLYSLFAFCVYMGSWWNRGRCRITFCRCICLCLHLCLLPRPHSPTMTVVEFTFACASIRSFSFTFAFTFAPTPPSHHASGRLCCYMRFHSVVLLDLCLHLCLCRSWRVTIVVFVPARSWRGLCLFTRLCLMHCAQAHNGYCVPSGIGVSHCTLVFAFCLLCLHGVLVKSGAV